MARSQEIPLRFRWFTALLLLGTTHVASAVAGDPSPAAVRPVFEEQIAAILSERTAVLPPLAAGGEVRIEKVPLDAPTDGTVFTETTAFFEGCVLVVRLVHFRPIGGQTGWRQIETRVDLSLIETAPELVTTRPPSSHPQFGPMGGSVRYQWRPEVQRRMKALQRLASAILDDAMAKFPSDVETRLTWIAKRHDEELVDKIYLNAGERTYFVNGEVISGPLLLSPLFSIEGEQAATFVNLVHRYQSNYCGERLSI